ncbi:GNAT family N-acetyltransferase [Pseudonocardia sp.]|uniref:GNAT family N-acetyltransferase n=1 Tax=Pseudonocardia sp. TaxID=60912 RepID=UPI003D0B28A5
MIVRREVAGDATRDVLLAAFETSLEAGLLDALRADPGWLPRLSLVAERAGTVVGHVVCTRGYVASTPALGLGPLAVLPEEQGRGVGSALMHAVLGAADAADEPFVALLGEPAYYGRFGFVAASERGIAAPDPAWGGYFQVRALTAYRPVSGTFAYAAPFSSM